jgi:hypothetical protein
MSFGLIFETGSKKGITGQYYVLKSVRSGKYRRYLRRVPVVPTMSNCTTHTIGIPGR